MTATPGAPMQPTRDPRVTLPDLLEVLLNKGVYLNLDLIITVADIPLIGVNLRATIAGMETMLEYGMMRSWDERTRAWVRSSLARQLPLDAGEEVVARMSGGHLHEDLAEVWRPGTVYLTTRRLAVFRRDPREVLWQARLEEIEALELRTERSIGGEDRVRLQVTTDDGAETLLSAAAPERLRDLALAQGAAAGKPGLPPAREAAGPLLEDRVWYLEARAGGALWRGGTGRLDREDGLVWKGALDARPAVRLRPDVIETVRVEPGHTPLGTDHVLVVAGGGVTARLAVDDLTTWLRELDALAPGALQVPAGTAGAP